MRPGTERADEASPRLTFASATFDFRPMAALLRDRQPDWDVRVWPDPGWDQAEVAICWNTPAGLYARMPHLRLVHGIAAGVDNILGEDVRGAVVCRVVDADQVQGMVDYVLWSVLYFQRRFDQVMRQQLQGRWQRPALRHAQDFRVGVAGLGAMGSAISTALVVRGYRVSGFSRGRRGIDGVECFSGDEELPAFLAALDLLVCALPLTAATQGILSSRLFEALPRGAALVHVGRGEHLKTEDLRQALVTGQLCGAIVDVFPDEPLTSAHPLWRTPGLVVTPHMATMAAPMAIVGQVIENVRSLQAGGILRNAI